VPLRVLDPFLARYGDDAPDRVRLIIESDLESTDGEREK
jgi:hypothetical protein